MAKISQKMRHTRSTLKILGIAWTSAFTTTYRNKQLEIHVWIEYYPT